ncbi:hypothetical protein VHUM_04240 [Vanrija humicola]|uniref:BZIP domain-containing protein n=1 Tax=Vanrija humicola TaxID=5417 RepID=A0A7D8UXW4_VANHU|nr:hypothetical protein VHUM_04240 [Vanrija humicola]
MLPNLGTDWLINNNLANTNAAAAAAAATAPAGGAVAAATAPSTDYFPTGPWSSQPLSTRPGSASSGSSVPNLGQAGPSNYYLSFYGGSIAPSLLAPGGSTSSASSHISSSVDVVDKIIASESPIGATTFSRGRTHSVDSDADHEAVDGLSQHSHSEHEHDHDEGVERDGMIWGMKVDEYRALSARERKRVRNRISARTFRAKRKEHLSSLESTLGAKDLEIKLAHEENARLRRELADMRRRLSKYETQKPY